MNTHELEIMPIKRADVTAQFTIITQALSELIAKAETLTVTSREQVAEMKQARELRLSLKSIRVAIEKKRKELGEDALRQKQAIDSLAKDYKDKIETLEAHLETQEKFLELLEAKERAERLNQRLAIMAEFSEVVSIGGEVADMSEDNFAMLKDGAAAKLAALQSEREKAEQERIAKEQAEIAERERIRLENVKLKVEQEHIEKEREAERKAAAEALAKQQSEAAAELEKQRKAQAAQLAKEKALLAAERAERERIEREAKAEADRLAKIEADRLAAEKAEQYRIKKEKRAAELAPTKNKIKAFAETVKSLAIPVSAEENKAVHDAMKSIVDNALEALRSLYQETK